ncbi:MAG: hypothetical protein KC910_33715, partial [Candidatus Eremiobacteraeota bacterium]|nr:hypothetical protein [Candidatus Eremiobacteraeota bacterium]
MDKFLIASKIDWTVWLATAARVLLIVLIARLAVLAVQKGVAHFKTSFVERKRRASPGAAQRAETVVGMVTQALLIFIWAITAV